MLQHIDRVMRADLSFLVILSAGGSMIDGSHLLVAAIARGTTTVRVVQFEQDPMPGYSNKSESK